MAATGGWHGEILPDVSALILNTDTDKIVLTFAQESQEFLMIFQG